MDGFLALYIFMLAAICGHVIISRVPVMLNTGRVMRPSTCCGLPVAGNVGEKATNAASHAG